MAVLDKEFHRAMVDGYTRAKRECGYTATHFLQLVAVQGGVRAAKTLLNKGETSEGFGKLWEYGRLDLTMEARKRCGLHGSCCRTTATTRAPSPALAVGK